MAYASASSVPAALHPQALKPVAPLHLNAHSKSLSAPISSLEAVTSMDPKDYQWASPSPQQQQQLYQQFMQMAFFCYMSQQQAMCQHAAMPGMMPMSGFPAPASMPHAPCYPSSMPSGTYPTWQQNTQPAVVKTTSEPVSQVSPQTVQAKPAKGSAVNTRSKKKSDTKTKKESDIKVSPKTAAESVSAVTLEPTEYLVRASSASTGSEAMACQLPLDPEHWQRLLEEPDDMSHALLQGIDSLPDLGVDMPSSPEGSFGSTLTTDLNIITLGKRSRNDSETNSEAITKVAATFDHDFDFSALSHLGTFDDLDLDIMGTLTANDCSETDVYCAAADCALSGDVNSSGCFNDGTTTADDECTPFPPAKCARTSLRQHPSRDLASMLNVTAEDTFEAIHELFNGDCDNIGNSWGNSMPFMDLAITMDA